MGTLIYSWLVKNTVANLRFVIGVLSGGSLSIQVNNVRTDRTELYSRTSR